MSDGVAYRVLGRLDSLITGTVVLVVRVLSGAMTPRRGIHDRDDRIEVWGAEMDPEVLVGCNVLIARDPDTGEVRRIFNYGRPDGQWICPQCASYDFVTDTFAATCEKCAHEWDTRVVIE